MSFINLLQIPSLSTQAQAKSEESGACISSCLHQARFLEQNNLWIKSKRIDFIFLLLVILRSLKMNLLYYLKKKLKMHLSYHSS